MASEVALVVSSEANSLMTDTMYRTLSNSMALLVLSASPLAAGRLRRRPSWSTNRSGRGDVSPDAGPICERDYEKKKQQY